MDKWKDSDKMKKVDAFLKETRILNLAGIKALLDSALRNNSFNRFDASDPSKDHKGIAIGFTVQDAKTDRDDRAAKIAFKETVVATLRSTNWRLLENTVEASLGLITGRIKGYQHQAELRDIVEKEISEGLINIDPTEAKKEKPGTMEGITL